VAKLTTQLGHVLSFFTLILMQFAMMEAVTMMMSALNSLPKKKLQ